MSEKGSKPVVDALLTTGDSGRRVAQESGEHRELLMRFAGHREPDQDRLPNIRCDERAAYDRQRYGKRCGERATTLVNIAGGRLLVCDSCAQAYHVAKEPVDLSNVTHLRVILSQIAEDAHEAISG